MKRFGLIVAAAALGFLGALAAGCGSSDRREGSIGLQANEALAVQAGDPVLAAAPGYAGSKACSFCHPGIFADWSRTLHNKPLKTVAELGDAIFVNDADGNGVNDFRDGLDLGVANPKVDSAFLAFGANAPRLSFAGGRYLVTIGAVQFEVQRVQGGNGFWKQRYQTRIGRAYYILPVQYNEVEKRYTVYNGANWYTGGNAPRFTMPYGSDNLVLQFAALNNATDRKGIAVSWENKCAGCHQTGLSIRSDDSASYGGTAVTEVVSGYVELNIGCEACHGPGAAHAASRNAADIINPGNFLVTGTAGVQRANEVCGSCHSRGTSVQLPGISDAMEAPALLSGNSIVGFRPGNNLLNDLGASGFYVSLTTSAFWGSANFAAADVNSRFPLFNASKNHHQQWMDIQQGPHAADKPFDVPCFGCHSPHSSANRHMIATTVKEGGVVKVSNTKEENNTLCLACHATFGDFASITTADVQAVADGRTSAAIVTATQNHLIDRAHMAVSLDLANGVGRCTACHMAKTARSATFSAAFVDADGKQKGDIHAHTLKLLMPNVNVVDLDNTYFNRSDPANSLRAGMPNSCSGCHKGAAEIGGNYEIYGWARSGHADYLDTGIGGYGDRLNRSAATAEPYNSTSNASCVPCHTEAGYVAFLGGAAATAHFIPPTEKNFLNCNTCHSSRESEANGHVRQIASVTFPSGLAVTSGESSKICFKCHGGLGSKANVDAATPSGGLFSVVDPHNRVAAAMLYGPQARGGYEYDNVHSTIAQPVVYTFNTFHIGVSCIGCHMAAAPAGNWNIGGHALRMTDGAALNTTACTSCHGAVTSFEVSGSNRNGEIAALLTAVRNSLTSRGVVAPAGSPFFDNITTAAQLRAVYNLKFVSEDPGAYVHNWRYAAQLLYDSLDELDDAIINRSVAVAGVNRAEFGR